MASKMVLPERLTPATVAATLGGRPITRVGARSEFLNILIYGDSGVGKTTLGGSASVVPEMAPVIVLDQEGGTESLRRKYPDAQVVRVLTWEDMRNVYAELKRGDHGFKTVIVDSLTEVQKFNMYSVMSGEVSRKEEDGKFMDPDVPGMREWGKSGEQMRRFIRDFRDLEMHTIFTALETSNTDQITGAKKTFPSLPGKLAAEVAAYLDIVGYYYQKEVQDPDTEEKRDGRFILFKKTARQVAKDRTDSLPMVMPEPTMASIYEAIKGSTQTTSNS